MFTYLILLCTPCEEPSALSVRPLWVQLVKNRPARQENPVRHLGQEDPLEEGQPYPLQYSGLENSMDSTVHGAAKSRTQLSESHFHYASSSSLDIIRLSWHLGYYVLKLPVSKKVSNHQQRLESSICIRNHMIAKCKSVSHTRSLIEVSTKQMLFTI